VTAWGAGLAPAPVGVRTLDLRLAVAGNGELDDVVLLRRVRAGDEAAFRSLFRRYAALAKGLALRVVNQPFLAEEIVQEAFLALWRQPDAFREERGSFRSWLLSTVHHRAVDTVRREEAQRRRREEQEATGPVAEDFADSLAEADAVRRSGERVRAALEDLPDEQRRVLEMMYFEGKTQARVADELGLPLGTVKSRTLLGMRRLRSMLVEVER
jgi:RNA polymerase sigma-70 factor (ECF subfamily)